jgi:hypothetical protein
MRHLKKILCMAVLGVFAAGSVYATTEKSKNTQDPEIKSLNVKCINCHMRQPRKGRWPV